MREGYGDDIATEEIPLTGIVNIRISDINTPNTDWPIAELRIAGGYVVKASVLFKGWLPLTMSKTWAGTFLGLSRSQLAAWTSNKALSRARQTYHEMYITEGVKDESNAI